MRQDELALAAGVSTRAIHQIENGKPTSRLDTVLPVLAALGLKLRIE
jgi:DNA-binding XRE family transcriptional regulator